MLDMMKVFLFIIIPKFLKKKGDPTFDDPILLYKFYEEFYKRAKEYPMDLHVINKLTFFNYII